VAATAAGLLGTAAFTIDLPVARWFKSVDGRALPGDFARIVTLSEVFGYSLSAAVIVAAAALLDPGLRGRLLGRFVAAAFAGGLVADLIKATIPRIRPRAADLAQHASAAASFLVDDFVAGGGGGGDIKSFPSGHSAMAAGLTAALCWRYPRGTPLFVAVGLLAGLQRLTSSAHYPSDVAIGAAIGLGAAALFTAGGNGTIWSTADAATSPPLAAPPTVASPSKAAPTGVAHGSPETSEEGGHQTAAAGPAGRA
jgi:membrane-associated phospholipid phosphatase